MSILKFPLVQSLETWLLDTGISENYALLLKTIILITAICIVCIIVDFIARRIILAILSQVIKKSKNKWDDILLEKRVFHRLSHYFPAIIVYHFAGLVFSDYPELIPVIKAGAYIYMIILAVCVLKAFFQSLNDIYMMLPHSGNRPIKGFIQVGIILVYIIASILILSIILDKDPSYFLTGLGALAAVLLLVFRDTLLGLVAGIQLSSNDMVKLGDWVSMPSKGADGQVTEISLHTVKIQNWDKSISMIPAYTLVSESFINWRGMEESGARRLKRSLNIDIKSIRLVDDAWLSKFSKMQLIADHIAERSDLINKFNSENNIDTSVPVNGRRMTNIGTFRLYIEHYLRNIPDIRQDMMLIVRQLQPTETGLPIEIYAFSRIQEWEGFEALQADIFDHILSVLPEFGLQIFQNPSEYPLNK